jgi:cellulose synthase/poly-beta-1,6-N-acetylglucosamine synthase-like glycosyltransferase
MQDTADRSISGVSVIIPVCNAAETLTELIERVHQTLSWYGEWEAIIVDDHSTDNSIAIAEEFAECYPIQILPRAGEKSKVRAIREGLKAARYPALAVIEAGLRYRPEYLGIMFERIQTGEADIVVTRRDAGVRKTIGQWMSWAYSKLIIRLLFGLDYDSQSSLKMFTRKYLPAAMLSTGLKNFDLPFLWHAAQAGARIVEQDIICDEQRKKAGMIRFIIDGSVMVKESFWLKLRGLSPLPLTDEEQIGQAGSGIWYKDKKFITHNYLPSEQSAFKRFNRKQIVILLMFLAGLAAAFLVNWQAALVAMVGLMSLVYLMDVVFMLLLSVKSLLSSPEISIEQEEIKGLVDEDLPVYTILCPLYKEPEVVEQFVKAMMEIDWPADKLDVQLLIEEDDQLTKEVLDWMYLPGHIQVRVVPQGLPKTKPKACNYGLAYARGEYVVIFDAEDIPERDQLKKAYLAFQKVGPEVVCMQARLDYYNARQNLLTCLFATEYNLWFGVVLPGLYAWNAPIPLGGTSNHFRRAVLNELSGWDPFNVTEDCDLGIRLFSLGYRTAIIDSNTHEEANSQLGNWIRQRSRWIKGYAQTQLVAWREIDAIAEQGWDKFLIFILVFVHKAFSLFINPFLWLLTIGYFMEPHLVEPVTKLLFSGPIGYIGTVTMLVGNFLYFYSHMLAAVKTRQWWMVKYTFVIPFYWLLMSVAGWYGMWQLIVKPHYWEKTRHGLSARPNVSWQVLFKRAVKFD